MLNLKDATALAKKFSEERLNASAEYEAGLMQVLQEWDKVHPFTSCRKFLSLTAIRESKLNAIDRQTHDLGLQIEKAADELAEAKSGK